MQTHQHFIYPFKIIVRPVYISIISSYRAVNTLRLDYKKTSQFMYTEIIVVCSQIHTKTHKYPVWAERRISERQASCCIK